MNIALDTLASVSNCRPVFYMNRAVRAYLRVKMMDKNNLYLTVGDMATPNGITRRGQLYFQGIPCRVIDGPTLASGGILNTETRITVGTT